MNPGTDRDDKALVVQIRKQPPLAVFLEEAFETDIVVQGTGGSDDVLKFNVLATLVVENSSIRGLANLAVLLEPSPLEQGVCGTIRCSISTGAAETQLLFQRNPVFQIHISVRPSTASGEGLLTVLGTAITSSILVVKYKIMVSPSADWSPVWHKDEGGRDKCLEVMAGVYNHRRALLYEAVPLLHTLCYSTSNKRFAPPIPVTNQDLLRILTPKANQLSIDKSTGTIKIRFRIEDVSKNHQGQDFCVQISAADDRDGNRRIGPGFTPPITIRSKRTKRGRLAASTAVPPVGASSEHQVVQYSFPSADQSGSIRAFEGPDVLQLRDAVRGVARWVDDVVSGLYPLQWQVVGYTQDARGNPEYSRPYHNMQNPNALIARVLTTYNESTRDQLQLLQQSLNTYAPQAVNIRCTMHPASVASLPPHPPTDPRRGIIPPGYPPRQPVRDFRRIKRAPQRGQPERQQIVMEHSARESPARESVPTFRSEKKGTTAEVIERTSTSSPPADDRKTAGAAHDALPDRNRESAVEYLLAKQFKSIRSGERLGFPAYSSEKDLLGFYKMPPGKNLPDVFLPISDDDFGPAEILQATKILEEADPDAVHSLKQCGSVSNMLNRALVYEWSQGLAGTTKK